ncbi:MAG: hypothetical protein RLY63_634, partial [Chloroflexota bacterium]
SARLVAMSSGPPHSRRYAAQPRTFEALSPKVCAFVGFQRSTLNLTQRVNVAAESSRYSVALSEVMTLSMHSLNFRVQV